MPNIYVNTLGVPRKARNKRIYAGNSFNVTNARNDSQSGGSSTQRHFESGRLTNFILPNVIVYFTTVFAYIPTMVNLKVYRIVELETDKYVMQDVLFYKVTSSEIANEYGFGLVIDASEDLTGVIVEYCFTE